MTRILFYINSKEDLIYAQNYIHNHPNEKVTVVASTFEGQMALANSNFSNNLFFKADSMSKQKIIDLADKLSKNWCKQDSSFYKSLQIEKVNLGHLQETTLLFFFAEVVRSYFTSVNLLHSLNPTKIFLPLNAINLKGSMVKDIRLDCEIVSDLSKYYPKITFKKYGQAGNKRQKNSTNSYLLMANLFLKSPFSYIYIFYLYLTFIIKNIFKNESKQTKKILVFAQRNHFTSFISFLNELKLNFDIKIISSALLKIHLIPIYKSNLSFKLLELLKNPKINVQTQDLEKGIKLAWEKYKKERKLETLLDKYNLESLSEITTRRLDVLINEELEEQIQTVLVATSQINFYKPDLVITMTDTTPKDMSFVLAANNKHIKTLLIQHGALVYKPLLRSTAKYIASWGQASRNWWTKEVNKPRRNIFITGAAYFDKYEKVEPLRYKVKKSKPLKILLATTYMIANEQQRFRLMKMYFDELSTLDNIILSVRTYSGRLHKNDNLTQLASLYNYPISIDSEQNAKKDIEESDIVLVETTSFALEALILGKPVIYLNYLVEKDQLPLAISGAAYGAYIEGDVNLIISTLRQKDLSLRNEKRISFLNNYCYKIDGRSSARIIKLIDNLI